MIYFATGMLMLVVMIVFVLYALQHPEKSLPINIKLTYILYAAYLILMVMMFILYGGTRHK